MESGSAAQRVRTSAAYRLSGPAVRLATCLAQEVSTVAIAVPAAT
jgi:hypothetical protein